MRHLQPFPALMALAMIGAACSGPAASSGGNQSQAAGASQGGAASQGAAASQPAASTGGGGGGGGVNGKIHYEITGDATKSGDLDFFNNASVSQFTKDGWVAYFHNTDSSVVIQVSSSPSAVSVGYVDGEITIVGAQSNECTFDFSRNDAGGLKGTIDCPNPTAFNSTSAAQIHIHFHATVDAHT